MQHQIKKMSVIIKYPTYGALVGLTGFQPRPLILKLLKTVRQYFGLCG